MLKRIVSILFILFHLNCLGGILERGGKGRDPLIVPSATIIRSNKYKVLERSSGESSQFFLFGMIPMTTELNVEYALSQAVQKVTGGDSMVDVIIWHEIHYYFPLGTVTVIKVEGDVVSLKSDVPEPVFEDPKNKKSKGGKKN